MWFHNIFNAKSGSRPGRAARSPVSPRTADAGQQTASLLSSHTLRRLNHLSLNTDPMQPSQMTGARTSANRKPATEFREHRQYASGDDVRYVDWKASARQEHIFIKQSTEPKAELVYLLLDCSASMAWGSPPKSGTALALANLLGYLALAHQDRLLVLPVTDASTSRAIRPMGPLWGKGQAAMLNRYLQTLPFRGHANVYPTLAGLGRRKLSQGGLVLVISDLLGTPDLSKVLAALPAPAWKVVFCHLLHPDELNPPINGQFEMQDIETGQKKHYPVTAKVLQLYRQRLQAWRDQLTQTCLERRAIYTMLPTNGSISQDILPELQRAQVVKRL